MRLTSFVDPCRRSSVPPVAARHPASPWAAAIALAIVATCTPPVAAGQAPADGRRLLRVHVTGPTGHPIADALVEVGSPDAIVRGRTDSAGRSVVAIETASAIIVRVRAVGMLPHAVRLPPASADSTLRLSLRPVIVALEAMQIRRARRRPARGDWPDLAAATSQPWGPVAPGEEGYVGAVASGAPGVGIEDGAGALGLSVLGIEPALNVATLDGGEFGGTRVPRDAVMATRVSPASFDATRPGAAGAAVAMRTVSGTNAINRAMRVSVDDPLLQQGSRERGSEHGEFRDVQVSALASGPVIIDRLHYLGALQVGRSVTALTLREGGGEVSRGTAGLDDDGARRLGEALRTAGLSAGAFAEAGVRDGGTALLRLDLRREDSYQLTTTASAEWSGSASSPAGDALPSTATRHAAWSGTTVTSYSMYTEGGFLNESRLTVAASRTAAERRFMLPAGIVIVPTGSAGAGSRVRLGGSSAPTGTSASRALEAEHSTSWLSFDDRHYWRATLSGRIDDSRAGKEGANALGTFEFGSLDELAASSASSFRRSFAEHAFAVRSANVSLAIGDVWMRDQRLSVQYGLRLEGSSFLTGVPVHPVVDSAFESVSGSVPHDLFASPRAAFAWRVGSLPPLTPGGTARPRGTLRGGVGAFRGRATPAQLRPALDVMGRDALDLVCVGDGVPTPAWGRYLDDPASIPSACVGAASGPGAGTPLARAIVFADSYAPPRHWRVALGWNGALPWGLQLNADAIHTFGRRMPSTVDLNLRQRPAFTLDDEGGRPVYVDAASIVASTGAVLPTTARRVDRLASVHELRADLHSESRQVMLSVTPLGAATSRLSWTVGYAWLKAREQGRGYGQPTFGDPRAIEWSPGVRDVRHTVTAAGGVRLPLGIRVVMSGRLASGRAYTPLVGGDVNGDGTPNDRAFVIAPDAARVRGDSGLADAMDALLHAAPDGARACLRRQLGRPAGRSSCRAPWSALVDVQLFLRPQSVRLTDRAALSLHLANPLSGLDALLHGASRVRGWGRMPSPDPVLMYPIGFDSSTRSFRHAINPRFGDSRSLRSQSRNPFRVTVEARLEIGPARDRQLLDAELRRERASSAARRSAAELRRRYVTVAPNPMRLVLARATTLGLTREQVDTIRAIDKRFLATADSIWRPVAAYLAELGEQYDLGDAVRRVRDARRATADSLALMVGPVRTTLTPAQREQLPPFVREQLDERAVRAAGRRASY